MTTLVREGPNGRLAIFDSEMVFRYKLVIPIQHPMCGPSMDLVSAYPLRGILLSIGLNPSTADEMRNDPTVRRDLGYARAWGYSQLCKANIFAYRSTEPDALYDAAEHGQDIVGPDNDEMLCNLAATADLVLCVWGNHGALAGRGAVVRAMLVARGIRLHHLKLTQPGQPSHNLYLKGDLTPRPWI